MRAAVEEEASELPDRVVWVGAEMAGITLSVPTERTDSVVAVVVRVVGELLAATAATASSLSATPSRRQSCTRRRLSRAR